MNQYAELDRAILASIESGSKYFYQIENDVEPEARRLSLEVDRSMFRIIDGRLQALKRKGLISFSRQVGWRVK